jgi:hypothetical protein
MGRSPAQEVLPKCLKEFIVGEVNFESVILSVRLNRNVDGVATLDADVSSLSVHCLGAAGDAGNRHCVAASWFVLSSKVALMRLTDKSTCSCLFS